MKYIAWRDLTIQTQNKIFKFRRMVGELTMSEAANEAVPKDIMKEEGPKRPPKEPLRRLHKGRI